MLTVVGSAQSATFTPIGDLPGGDIYSAAWGISADGTTVVGASSTASGSDGFRWRADSGISPLGLVGGAARGVSGDGSVVVGINSSQAFRWDAAGGAVLLGDLPGGATFSTAYAISADGTTIVGRGRSATGEEAFRWTTAEGMIGMGDLPGGFTSSTAYDVSADGQSIVGASYSGAGLEAFIWTPSTGMQSLGDLPGGRTIGTARGISSDGSIIVGQGSDSTSNNVAWIWDGASGFAALPLIPGAGPDHLASAVSDDGLIVVGSNYGRAFIWDATNGTQSLRDLLVGLGVDLTGWHLADATGISADGRSIVGYGTNPSGATEAFLAYIPEPIEDRNVDDPDSATYQKTDGSIVDPIRDLSGAVYPYPGPDLTPGVWWSNASLPGADLLQADLSHAQLPGVNLHGSRLDGADLSFANVMGGDLGEIDLRSCNLEQTILEESDLSGSNLSGMVLRQARMRGSNLSLANLSNAVLYEADLGLTTIRDADLSDTDLYRANLALADLTGTDLSRSDLFGANLQQANLTNTVLTGAYYGQTTFPAGFDPVAAGMLTGPRVINNGLAPPNEENVIDRPEVEFIVNNAGCNALLEYPCVSPGAPTSVLGSAQHVTVFDSSTFSGTVFSGISLRDSSKADVMLLCESCGAGAGENSTLTVNANAWIGANLGASGDAIVLAGGGRWEDVYVSGRSHVILGGGEADGAFFEVSDEALLEINQDTWDLRVSGGRAILRGEAYSGTHVEEAGTLEVHGGHLNSDRPYRLLGNRISGRMFMTSGSIGPGDFRVNGYASLSGGMILALPATDDPPDVFPGPWNFSSYESGLIEMTGGAFGEYVSLGARDASRIRLFGSSFAVDGMATPHGALPSPAGILVGTLASGDPINNAFAHRGADCGGQPCTGRILVLAPGLDWDQDAVPNPFDNCAEEPNADQTDIDDDGTGDVCFAPVDLDRDSIIDALDNCRVDPNPGQADSDSDGVGDACEKNLIFWADKGLEGCTTPPKRLPYEMVTNDLGNSDVIDRSAQPCDCFGIEYPVTPGTASVRFLHRTESGFVEEYCENVAPYALGLGPNQPICADGLDEDGLHEVMATPYDAPGCEAGGGNALPSSLRSFTMAAPEPGLAVMVGAGVSGLAGVSRRRKRSA